jgi:hypothetical protein
MLIVRAEHCNKIDKHNVNHASLDGLQSRRNGFMMSRILFMDGNILCILEGQDFTATLKSKWALGSNQ